MEEIDNSGMFRVRVKKLVENEKLVKLLESSRLQKVINEIDGAKDRFSELEKELESNPHFSDFIKEMMITMNYFDKDGNFLDN